MWSCDPILVTLAFLWENLSKRGFYKDLTRKNTFFEGWSWLKFIGNGIMALKFYTSVATGLKLKLRKFWGLSPTFVEVTGEELVGIGGGESLPPSPPHPE